MYWLCMMPVDCQFMTLKRTAADLTKATYVQYD